MSILLDRIIELERKIVRLTNQRNTHRDAWVEQLAEIYGVDPATLTNGKG